MWWLLLACGNPTPELVPGVLLVTIDTWRADHLTAKLTPEAWHVATTGARFENAYTTIGLTTPAHASLFTGKTPAEHGLRGNNHHGYTLDLSHQTVAEIYKEQGWSTAAFVSAFPAGPEGGIQQGFEVFNGPSEGERTTDETLAKATAWLESQTKPWFLWVHAYDPHGPYENADVNGEKSAYAKEVTSADKKLGPLTRAVLNAGGSVALTSDHGEVLDEEICQWQHERSSSDHVLRIPLVLAGPKVTPGTYTERVGITDLFSTLLELGNLNVPPASQSQSLLSPQHREIWLAESGLCESDCSPGCSPTGFTGKDLVAIGDSGRLTLRPGKGYEGDLKLKSALDDYTAPKLPVGDKNLSQGRALGYVD